MGRTGLGVDEDQFLPKRAVGPWLRAALVSVVLVLSVMGALILTYGDLAAPPPLAELISPTATLTHTPSSTPSPTWTATRVLPAPTPTRIPATPTPRLPTPTFAPYVSIPTPAPLQPTAQYCMIPPYWWAYRVQLGDSLPYLAVVYRTTPAVIMTGNCLTYPLVYVGQILYMPPVVFWQYPGPTGTAQMTTVLPCSTTPLDWVPYVVHPGDTLYSLARSRGTTVEAVQVANCLSSYALSVGEVLYVPPLYLTPVIIQSPLPTATSVVDPAGSPMATPTSALPTATSTSPLPTASATATPSCTVTPTGSLGTVWDGDVVVRNRLHCPTTVQALTLMAKQPFERGKMFWRGDKLRIYVLYDTGRWEWFFDTWREGQPLYSCDVGQSPSDLLQPVRGFGSLWCALQGVREGVGWATVEEQGPQGIVQDFEEGLMFDIPDEGIFILYADTGTWEQRQAVTSEHS
jgi:LysM repeat protein